ncbi:MAG: hypothetical protein A6F71_08600 [Cycloclasticus sp. symbiont of Poecilosclerida sp. M]|nr:MAG: hypothetical protein A6F71_08600 [Cycloclasticus sp. symbiont of Poecilosclerida sp. M]
MQLNSNNARANTLRQAYTRHDDTEEVIDDISPEYLAVLKKSYYTTKVMVTKEEADDIEKGTCGQSDNDQWKKERSIRITASVVGGICKMRKNTKKLSQCSTINSVEMKQPDMVIGWKDLHLLHQQQKGNPGLRVHETGLVVSSENPWLAASPDNRVHNPTASLNHENLRILSTFLAQ